MRYQRIVSLAPSNTEILFELDLGKNLVGVTSYCDFPDTVSSIEKIGTWIKNDEKKIEKLNPDIILGSMYVPDEIIRWAKEKKVKLVNLYPQTLERIYESIEELGELFERQKEAGIIVAKIKKELRLISSKKAKRKFKVYSEEFHKPPMVAANWVPELIEIAGGIPMSRPGKLSYEVKGKDVLKFDPDIIILHWCGYKDKSIKADIRKRKYWENIMAVNEGKIFAIDDTFLNRPGPRIWMGAKLISDLLDKVYNYK